MVVGDDDKAAYRAVTLGGIDRGLRIVTAGLKAGDRIVVNGLQRVRPGALVEDRGGWRWAVRRPQTGRAALAADPDAACESTGPLQKRQSEQRGRSRSADAGPCTSQSDFSETSHEPLQILHRPADLRGRAVDPDLPRRADRRCRRCRSRNIRTWCRRRWWCARISRRQSEGDRRDGGDADRGADQRRRGHALYEQPGDHRRR